MPAKKPARSITSAKAAKPEPSSTPAVSTGSGRAGVFALVAVCLIVAALVMAIRDGSEPTEAAAADAKVAAAAAHATQPTTAATPKAKTSATSAAATTTAASPSESAVAKPSSALSATVTVAGCLERTGDGFRLKDTSGADAPKSRSWKTGFFKKSSASIDVVDAANGLKLANYAGSRVSVTGTLIDREMRAHSLQRLQGACK